MAKRGDAARAEVMSTITNAFATTGNLVGTIDKKIYVTADDGGEILQFAISITMPEWVCSIMLKAERLSTRATGRRIRWSCSSCIAVGA